eukprot:gene7261-biopygen9698
MLNAGSALAAPGAGAGAGGVGGGSRAGRCAAAARGAQRRRRSSGSRQRRRSEGAEGARDPAPREAAGVEQLAHRPVRHVAVDRLLVAAHREAAPALPADHRHHVARRLDAGHVPVDVPPLDAELRGQRRDPGAADRHRGDPGAGADDLRDAAAERVAYDDDAPPLLQQAAHVRLHRRVVRAALPRLRGGGEAVQGCARTARPSLISLKLEIPPPPYIGPAADPEPNLGY